MSVDSVAVFLNQNKKNIEILRFEDTSTVAKAADSLGVTPGEIAKSLLFKVKDDFVMVLMAGDKRLDNKKFKEIFHSKAKMPEAEEVSEATGHPVGGVCPFGLKNPIPVFLDYSLQAYSFVFPAAGASNTAIKLTVNELEELTKGQWVDLIQA
ncbi:prolyl-tRNA synthetase [Desulfosporosinus sp. HMP52]|uniref:YbaK/EbsC family protein n=1 Tax=Desulfosporosinus sp. HMP52 TaxID=1487923 RepID=UPI00051FC129|nr:YbaK/EbsC family protein [Desulfosporosinus sp. HMP52]KGK86186.1 prolyl-tRNA synthetase [Desulfosporosinus sp. HMP52]